MIDKLSAEIKSAMIAKDSVRTTALRTILSEAKNVAISEKRKDATESDIISAVTKGIKQRQDSYDSYVSAGRMDLAELEKKEMDILTEFQPKQLTDVEISAMVDAIIAKTGNTSKSEMGKVMGEVMKSVKQGSVDGKLVSKIVASKLV